MASILVIARPNLDRAWRLEAPLVPGARIAFGRVDERYGGSGFFTGSALIALGHRVLLAGTLADDERGRAYRCDLIRAGFDVANVTMARGPTVPVEVLIEPSGERTILSAASVEHAVVADVPLEGVDLVYVNARRVDPRLMEAATRHSLVVAQAPLQAGERRACHVLIGSRGDLPTAQAANSFSFAQIVAGDQLRAYIVTDGARPVRIYGADSEATVPVPPVSTIADSSGAGDVFAAGIVDATIRGLPIVDAVRFGSALAARFLTDRNALFDASLTAPISSRSCANEIDNILELSPRQR